MVELTIKKITLDQPTLKKYWVICTKFCTETYLIDIMCIFKVLYLQGFMYKLT